MKCYLPASDMGVVEAYCRMGSFYHRGIAVEKDLKMAAKAGSADAHLALGCYYREGFTVEKDEKEAMRHFEIASNIGHGEALQIVFGDPYGKKVKIKNR